ncbi:MAG: mannose-1-phosphate guanylyltransferase/mannose-6-phosphate isomerase [Pseudomonadota bacterium]|nr:mannose-1-phosphate guanylyltransferase/mannose-6-phosphate isomerase [Pseudomonadota bacterium]
MKSIRNNPVCPVILSGGAGTRLWPLSRELYPKQMLDLVSSGSSMIQDTAARVPMQAGFAPPLVICNEEHRFVIAEQLRQAGHPPRTILLEPAGRNTAPAIALAALFLARTDPDTVMLVLPADHLVRDRESFLRDVDKAAAAARNGWLVTFGIRPAHPETGYGYIRQGQALENGAFRVGRFVEKPDLATAKAMIAAGDHLWNSGMFLFTARRVLEELARFQPEILAACRDALDQGQQDMDFLRAERGAFAQCPALSVDVGIMERTDRAAVVPAGFDWTDVGSWASLWEASPRDGDGNAAVGDVILQGSRRCYARTDRGLLALVGLENVVAVATEDSVLVASMDQVQDVRKIVAILKDQGRSEALSHPLVHRPWGTYRVICSGDGFQVKTIIVKPAGRLSLQKHSHRAEHWVVVRGTALVTRGQEQLRLQANQSVDIPVGMAHRLENPGTEDLELIEVQSGPYLGEDDIIRLEDVYGRV